MNVWEIVKRRLEALLSKDSYDNWLRRTSLSRIDGDVLWVSVPNDETMQWLQSEYADMIRQALDSLGLGYESVQYETETVPYQNGPGPFSTLTNSNDHFGSPLNPKFTFDSFVVGACNQLAHAAAKAVSSNPSKNYNPLYIYGGVGMGKTHLMHAVGRSLLHRFSGMRIIYTPTERFMNEMITCLRTDRMSQFHSFYRSADILLVDDIQVLGGKERTQEEFFHTFNELYDHQKQIIISSDQPPKDITGLVERLRSRFEWGLMVDMQPPDLETKIAILDKKAENEGIRLSDDVRIFIATKTKSNVRELEGVLVKLIALSSLTGEPINLQMAQQVIKHLAPAHDRRVTIDQIQKAVADHFRLKQAQLKEKSNSRTIAFPRQIAMYLVKELTSASLPEIGRAFGGKHHTTVIHSVQKITLARHKDPDLNKLIHKLMDSFQ